MASDYISTLQRDLKQEVTRRESELTALRNAEQAINPSTRPRKKRRARTTRRTTAAA